jgi:hypothetical protein
MSWRATWIPEFVAFLEETSSIRASGSRIPDGCIPRAQRLGRGWFEDAVGCMRGSPRLASPAPEMVGAEDADVFRHGDPRRGRWPPRRGRNHGPPTLVRLDSPALRSGFESVPEGLRTRCGCGSTARADLRRARPISCATVASLGAAQDSSRLTCVVNGAHELRVEVTSTGRPDRSLDVLLAGAPSE